MRKAFLVMVDRTLLLIHASKQHPSTASQLSCFLPLEAWKADGNPVPELSEWPHPSGPCGMENLLGKGSLLLTV